jgi:hypothetical protein
MLRPYPRYHRCRRGGFETRPYKSKTRAVCRRCMQGRGMPRPYGNSVPSLRAVSTIQSR